MSVYILIAIVAIVLLFALGNKGGDKSDIEIPAAPQRTDGYYGYYGVSGNQVAETKDHINLLFENFWDGSDAAIYNMRSAQMATVIDVANWVLSPWGPVPRMLAVNAKQSLRTLFDTLRTAGVLHLVKFITPTDEPNLPECGATGVLPEAVALIRKVSAEYTELAGAQLLCIYYSDLPMEHKELFDVVGFDQYEAKSSIFGPDGLYTKLRSELRPGQRTLLVPGATYGQDPIPFLNAFNTYPEVLMVVPFLWRQPHGDPKAPGIVAMPKMRTAYEAVGHLISGH